MLSILPHTHAFRCRLPGPATVYLASQPTVTGTVNTDHISYLGCALRTARLNDDCRPHPTTVAVSPHYPHTPPPDVPARLVYQRILVNRSAGLAARQRPPGPLKLGCPPPLHAQALARGPLAAVQLHRTVGSGTARAAVRCRRRCCYPRGRTPATSRRLPGQQQRQAPPTTT
jgi:hypothetical protein